VAATTLRPVSNGIPGYEARRAFVDFTERAEEAFGHTPFCGARSQFILDQDFVPVMVDGYTAMRQMAAGNVGVLGTTQWETGWTVQTRLDPHMGNFFTAIMASGYDISGTMKSAKTAKEALDNHKEAVVVVMKLADFHGRESHPSSDTQVLLEPALA